MAAFRQASVSLVSTLQITFSARPMCSELGSASASSSSCPPSLLLWCVHLSRICSLCVRKIPTRKQFDIETIPIEVTISDASIFNGQTGFRRAELLPASNSGIDDSTTGIKTLHFSIGKDAQRPLNLSHEYQLVFLESNDFSTNQFVLKTGTILGGDTAVDPDTLQLFGNVNQTPSKLLFSVPFLDGVFHNFAVTLDFDTLWVSLYYLVTSL